MGYVEWHHPAVFVLFTLLAQVSYPSDLLGISGAISSITTDFVKQLSVDANRAIIASDLVETCLPRMVVEADCRKSLPEGEYFNLTVSWTAGYHSIRPT